MAPWTTAADPGFSATSLGLVLPTHPEFAIHCVRPVAAPGSGPDMPWVSVEVNGWTALLVSCGDGGPSDDDPAEFLYGPGGDGTRPGLVVVQRVQPVSVRDVLGLDEAVLGVLRGTAAADLYQLLHSGPLEIRVVVHPVI